MSDIFGTKTAKVLINGKEYVGVYGQYGCIYLNLTDNGMIQKSGHIAYVSDKEIVGLPSKESEVILPEDVGDVAYIVTDEVRYALRTEEGLVAAEEGKGALHRYDVLCIDDLLDDLLDDPLNDFLIDFFGGFY